MLVPYYWVFSVCQITVSFLEDIHDQFLEREQCIWNEFCRRVKRHWLTEYQSAVSGDATLLQLPEPKKGPPSPSDLVLYILKQLGVRDAENEFVMLVWLMCKHHGEIALRHFVSACIPNQNIWRRAPVKYSIVLEAIYVGLQCLKKVPRCTRGPTYCMCLKYGSNLDDVLY
jgi:hypothetical protein